MTQPWYWPATRCTRPLGTTMAHRTLDVDRAPAEQPEPGPARTTPGRTAPIFFAGAPGNPPKPRTPGSPARVARPRRRRPGGTPLPQNDQRREALLTLARASPRQGERYREPGTANPHRTPAAHERN